MQVIGGEAGTVWVDVRYVTEEKKPFYVETLHPKIKIRKKPVDGKVVGYLKKGKKLVVYQVVLGWGKTDKGWVNLEYCIRLEDEVK